MICPNCKADNEDSSLYCRVCGTPMPKTTTNKSKTRYLWVLLGICVIGGIVILISLSNNNETYFSHSDASFINEESSEEEVEESIIAQPIEKNSIEEEYAQAETINDLRVLAQRGYLPAAYDLVGIFYRDERYEECSQFAYQCIDADYRVDDVWAILGELPTCYWRRDYYEY